jgi:hypothetical protein
MKLIEPGMLSMAACNDDDDGCWVVLETALLVLDDGAKAYAEDRSEARTKVFIVVESERETAGSATQTKEGYSGGLLPWPLA